MSIDLQHHNDKKPFIQLWQGRSEQFYNKLLWAEDLGVKWGAWKQDGLLYFVCCGVLKEYSPTPNLVQELWKNEADHDHSVLPWLILTRRFEKKKQATTQDKDLWSGWGDLGTLWYPTFALCFDPIKQQGSLGWKKTADSYGLASTLFPELFNLDLQFEPLSRGSSLESLELQPSDMLSLETFDSWKKRVDQVTEKCQKKELSKVVLARSLIKTAASGTRWSGSRLFFELLQSAQDHEIPFALSLRPKVSFVGLSPERLFHLQDRQIETHALAGTRVIQPCATAQEFEATCADLLNSTKDIEEHQIVVQELNVNLESLCDSIHIEARQVKQVRGLIHLETGIKAKLKEGVNGFQVLEKLHPTPALGGAPKSQALSMIRDDEPFERGGYAAPWAWCSGRTTMSAIIGIRSVLLSDDKAYIFAGAGVVSDSVAELEWEETKAKAEVIASLLNEKICINGITQQKSRADLVGTKITLAQSSLLRSLALVDALLEQELGGAVISPGSRNTPIALALEHRVETEICVDERSAGFVALGWAKTLGKPIALCCTSGSALAHYLPALIEAWYSAVPLLVLSADRPPRLRELGAPQTIDQNELFSRYTKCSLELPTERPLASSEQRMALSFAWKKMGSFAVKKANAEPPAPVHLNLPFEEPLWDQSCEPLLECQSREKTKEQKQTKLTQVFEIKDKRAYLDKLEYFTQSFSKAQAGLIYCGPLSPRVAQRLQPLLSRLSFLTGFPIVAEASSQLRGREDVFSCFDAYARAQVEGVEQVFLNPSDCHLMVMVGGAAHSRASRAWFNQVQQADWYYIGAGPETVNPESRVIRSFGNSLLESLALLNDLCLALETKKENRLTDDQLVSIQKAETWWHSYLTSCDQQVQIRQPVLWGGQIGRILLNQVQRYWLTHQQESDLIIASSMAFRDHDLTWCPDNDEYSHIWVNRGANGIDGTLSTALGVARGSQKHGPLIIWLGDLACYHDLQGLHKLSQWSRVCSNRPILVLMNNNDGGGIFEHLAVRESTSFDRLFKTSLKGETQQRQARRIDQRSESAWFKLAQTWIDRVEQVSDAQQLERGIEVAFQHGEISFIEVMTDAKLDHQKHLEFWKAWSMFLSAQINQNEVGDE